MIKFPDKFRFLVVGASNCGKSSLVANLIKNRNRCFDVQPKSIQYFCRYKAGVNKSILSEVEIFTKFPEPTDFLNESGGSKWIIIDDYGDLALNSQLISTVFKTCRHQNINIILLLHTLFSNKREAREISLNSTGIFLLRSCRDILSVKNLSYQLDPFRSDFLTNIYCKYVTRPYQYIFVDLDVRSHPLLRYRTNIFNQLAIEIFIDEEDMQELQQEELPTFKIPVYVLFI